MICSFKKEETRPDGSYIHSKCIRKAEVNGLCYACAYDQLLAENKRLEERIAELERLGKGYIAISEEVLKDQMVNVELGYKFRNMKDIFEQALTPEKKEENKRKDADANNTHKDA